MYDVLDGIRVLELGEWVLVPSASAILADWGADVIKIEHPMRGDSLRGLRGWVPTELLVQLVNRGKRNIAIDLQHEAGLEALYKLIAEADVFMTSFLPATLERLKISPADLRERNPNLIYARATGWGDRGPRAGQPGYDVAQVWAAAGIAYQMHNEDLTAPPMMPSSIGDFTSGLALVGSIVAALLNRERTGRAVDTSVALYGTGMWLTAQLVTGAAAGYDSPVSPTRSAVANPLANCYRTSDDRWIWLVFLQPDRWWRDLCEHLDHPELADDPRFASFDVLQKNAGECVATLESIFASRTLAEWREAFVDLQGVWTAVESPAEIVRNAQTLANGFITEAVSDDGSVKLVASPAQFANTPLGEVRQMSPFGADTEMVLLNLGYSWDDILKMKELGVTI